MAEYDLTATVNKVLGVSGKTSLVYIGYSQGLEIAFAELSTNKKLVSKIKLVVALAPVAYLANIKSPLRLLAPYANYVDVSGHSQSSRKGALCIPLMYTGNI